jgi:hypothetical protein
MPGGGPSGPGPGPGAPGKPGGGGSGMPCDGAGPMPGSGRGGAPLVSAIIVFIIAIPASPLGAAVSSAPQPRQNL